jgi:hypothetical protein
MDRGWSETVVCPGDAIGGEHELRETASLFGLACKIEPYPQQKGVSE